LLREHPDRAATEVADVEHLARAALADVRAAVAGYREPSLGGELASAPPPPPPARAPAAGSPAPRLAGEPVSARAALTAAGITPDLPTAVDTVPEDRRELFAWGVREGVTNVVRHSKASRCTVTLRADGVEVA